MHFSIAYLSKVAPVLIHFAVLRSLGKKEIGTVSRQKTNSFVMDYKKRTVECIGIRVLFSVPTREADFQRNLAQDTLSLCKTPRVGLLLRSEERIQLGTKRLLTPIRCVQGFWK